MSGSAPFAREKMKTRGGVSTSTPLFDSAIGAIGAMIKVEPAFMVLALGAIGAMIEVERRISQNLKTRARGGRPLSEYRRRHANPFPYVYMAQKGSSDDWHVGDGTCWLHRYRARGPGWWGHGRSTLMRVAE